MSLHDLKDRMQVRRKQARRKDILSNGILAAIATVGLVSCTIEIWRYSDVLLKDTYGATLFRAEKDGQAQGQADQSAGSNVPEKVVRDYALTSRP